MKMIYIILLSSALALAFPLEAIVDVDAVVARVIQDGLKASSLDFARGNRTDWASTWRRIATSPDNHWEEAKRAFSLAVLAAQGGGKEEMKGRDPNLHTEGAPKKNNKKNNFTNSKYKNTFSGLARSRTNAVSRADEAVLREIFFDWGRGRVAKERVRSGVDE
jgi:hypothetical protein